MPQPRVQAWAQHQSRGGRLQRTLRPLNKVRLRQGRQEDARSIRSPTPEFSLLDVHPAFGVDPRLQTWLGDSVPPESLHPRPSSASVRRNRHVAVCDELQQQPSVLQVEEKVWQDSSLSYVLEAKKRTAQLRGKTLELLAKDIKAAEEGESAAAAEAAQRRLQQSKDDSIAASGAQTAPAVEAAEEAKEAIGLLPSLKQLLPSLHSGTEDSSKTDDQDGFWSSDQFSRTCSEGFVPDEEPMSPMSSKDSGRKSISFSKGTRTSSKAGTFRKRLSMGRKASKDVAARQSQGEGATASNTEDSSKPAINSAASTALSVGGEGTDPSPNGRKKKDRQSLLLMEVRASIASNTSASETAGALEEKLKPEAKPSPQVSVAVSSPSPDSMGSPTRSSPSPTAGRKSLAVPSGGPQGRRQSLSQAMASLDPFQNRRKSSAAETQALDSQRLVLEQKRKLHGLTTEADITITRDILQGTSLVKVTLSQSEKESAGEIFERELAPYELGKLPVFHKAPDRDASYVWLLSQLVIFRTPGFKQEPLQLLIKGIDEELDTHSEKADGKGEENKESFTELANIFKNFQGQMRRHSVQSPEPENNKSQEEKAREAQIDVLAQTHDIPLDTAEALMAWFRALDISGDGIVDEDEFRGCVRAIYSGTKRTLTGGEAYLKRLWKDVTSQAKAKELKFEMWSSWLVQAFPQVRDMFPSEIRQFIKLAANMAPSTAA